MEIYRNGSVCADHNIYGRGQVTRTICHVNIHRSPGPTMVGMYHQQPPRPTKNICLGINMTLQVHGSRTHFHRLPCNSARGKHSSISRWCSRWCSKLNFSALILRLSTLVKDVHAYTAKRWYSNLLAACRLAREGHSHFEAFFHSVSCEANQECDLGISTWKTELLYHSLQRVKSLSCLSCWMLFAWHSKPILNIRCLTASLPSTFKQNST